MQTIHWPQTRCVVAKYMIVLMQKHSETYHKYVTRVVNKRKWVRVKTKKEQRVNKMYFCVTKMPDVWIKDAAVTPNNATVAWMRPEGHPTAIRYQQLQYKRHCSIVQIENVDHMKSVALGNALYWHQFCVAKTALTSVQNEMYGHTIQFTARYKSLLGSSERGMWLVKCLHCAPQKEKYTGDGWSNTLISSHCSPESQSAHFESHRVRSQGTIHRLQCVF